MEDGDYKIENGEVERKKERVVVVYCILFIILLCTQVEVMQHRILF
jgi:hypothetical protein